MIKLIKLFLHLFSHLCYCWFHLLNSSRNLVNCSCKASKIPRTFLVPSFPVFKGNSRGTRNRALRLKRPPSQPKRSTHLCDLSPQKKQATWRSWLSTSR